jgi:hypothetical protein
MSEQAELILGRIEDRLDGIASNTRNLAAMNNDPPEQLDIIVRLLERLLEESEKQTKFLDFLWKSERAR